jgi:hypothetical protein
MVRSPRTVGCLRTARPWMEWRWLDTPLGGRRCPIARARPGRLPHRGRWRAAVTIGPSASASANAPGCPPMVTVRDQAMRPRMMTPGDGTPGRSARSAVAVDHEPAAAPDRVTQPRRWYDAVCPAHICLRRTAPMAAAARPVARDGAGGPLVQTQCSRLRRSTWTPVHSCVRSARACPDVCVLTVLSSPVRPCGSPPAPAAPVPANGTPVETPPDPTVGSRRSVRPAGRIQP